MYTRILAIRSWQIVFNNWVFRWILWRKISLKYPYHHYHCYWYHNWLSILNTTRSKMFLFLSMPNSQKIFRISVTELCRQVTHIRPNSYLPRTNELKNLLEQLCSLNEIIIIWWNSIACFIRYEMHRLSFIYILTLSTHHPPLKIMFLRIAFNCRQRMRVCL